MKFGLLKKRKIKTENNGSKEETRIGFIRSEKKNEILEEPTAKKN